ncbi:hypothetical protein Lfu02_77810 [Longispora fulva]|uniref:Core-binding (CB) domain-containing protein n=1 Tax=Longispora fulva TaxID=619741 RepID=A0A8J7GP06_9ACTN|nr:hypothetical protein [Longispora fulva]MBG6136229.1 hypothetical protein [Longispora fulva]GIG63409.1 hypothetical protein Lfu02_77810 [Longispora fulva]
MLSGHVDGDQVFYSDLLAGLNRATVPIQRVAEVLAEMGVLVDDRPRAFDGWLERKLTGLASGVAGDTGTWLRTLHDGGPRAKPRAPFTTYNHMNNIRPILLDWSIRYGHLREVTRDDILAAIEDRNGSTRRNVLVSLQSLFSFCRKNNLIFRNTTRGIKVGEHAYGVIQQLRTADIERAVASATTPAARLILVLAASMPVATSRLPNCSSTTSTSATGG